MRQQEWDRNFSNVNIIVYLVQYPLHFQFIPPKKAKVKYQNNRARCWDHLGLEMRCTDEEDQGRPARQHSRTKPQGQDEKGAIAGTIVAPIIYNYLLFLGLKWHVLNLNLKFPEAGRNVQVEYMLIVIIRKSWLPNPKNDSRRILRKAPMR